MECLAVIAVSVALIFARLAMMQELNPVLWGTLALLIYAGAPVFMIQRGATWWQAPWVWLSSYGGLFLLFVAQCVLAERRRYRNRGGPAKPRRGKGRG